MATLNLGRIKPIFRGAYAGGTAYVVDDIVTSGGSSYICILASTGNATSNATYWTQMASGGTDVGTTITTQGDILFRDGSGLQRLAKGTAAQVLAINSGATAPEWVDASGGKTIKRHYFENSTRVAGGGSGAQFNFTTAFIPIDPTAGNNDLWVQSVAPMKGSSGDWFWGGLRWVKSGGSTYDHWFKGVQYVDPNSYQSHVSHSYNISAGTLPAGTYTVSQLAGDASSGSGSTYWNLNTSDHAEVGGQNVSTLMITEYKN